MLATWSELIDTGRMSDGEPNLLGTAKPARAMMSRLTASENGVRHGDPVRVEGRSGSITVPVVVADLPDRVVWLPTAAPGSNVRRGLGALAGDIVSLSAVGGGAV